jgi:hypothetical protein
MTDITPSPEKKRKVASRNNTTHNVFSSPIALYQTQLPSMLENKSAAAFAATSKVSKTIVSKHLDQKRLEMIDILQKDLDKLSNNSYHNYDLEQDVLKRIVQFGTRDQFIQFLQIRDSFGFKKNIEIVHNENFENASMEIWKTVMDVLGQTEKEFKKDFYGQYQIMTYFKSVFNNKNLTWLEKEELILPHFNRILFKEYRATGYEGKDVQQFFTKFPNAKLLKKKYFASAEKNLALLLKNRKSLFKTLSQDVTKSQEQTLLKELENLNFKIKDQINYVDRLGEYLEMPKYYER